jgi:hypothetical protein
MNCIVYDYEIKLNNNKKRSSQGSEKIIGVAGRYFDSNLPKEVLLQRVKLENIGPFK